MKDNELTKKLFDLCTKYEGVHESLHIINISDDYGSIDFRVYHSGGYCFNVIKEKIDIAEDESCAECIDGYEYTFIDQIFEGFKEIDLNGAINLFKNLK